MQGRAGGQADWQMTSLLQPYEKIVLNVINEIEGICKERKLKVNADIR